MATGTLHPGARFGDFEVLEVLGRGGFATVYRVRSQAGEAALKLLHSGALTSEAQRRRFQREAAALERLHHPHVVRLHGRGSLDGHDFLVLELVRGRSLADRLHLEGPVSSAEAAALGSKLAGALAAAHALGIVHRDVKPANVLLTEDGEPLLTDFGLVKDQARLGETQRLTRTGALMGTPGYWSPEQATAQEVGPPSDVYSLGASLYTALTAQELFRADSAVEAAAATVAKPPPRARETDPRVWPELDDWIQRCLAKEPAARPSAGELADALELLRSPRRGGRARWIAVGAAVGAVAVLAAVALPSPTQHATTTPPAPVAPSPAAEAAPPTSSTTSAADFMRRARRAAERGDWSAARASYVHAAERGGPDALQAMVEVGRLLREGRLGAPDPAGAARWFRRAADAGHAGAMNRYASMLRLGEGVPADPAAALRYYREAAERGDAAAMQNLGIAHRVGLGDLKRDQEEAVRWFRRAVGAGHAPAMINLGNALLNGQGAPQDVQAGIRWFERAAEAGQGVAARNLGVLYRDGMAGVRKDFEASARWFQRAAELGDRIGQFQYGLSLRSGVRGPRDDVAAAPWIRKAAEAGHPAAWIEWGLILVQGRGVSADPPAGLRWLERAAESGSVRAMRLLGGSYALRRKFAEAERWLRRGIEKGDAVCEADLGVLLMRQKKYRKANTWLRRAADRGELRAMYQLGVNLSQGVGAERDDAAAVELFQRAAKRGFAKAMGSLGSHYIVGRGVERDPAAGIRWLRKGVERGDPGAMRSLAAAYEQGRGVPQDRAEADRLRRLADEPR